MRDELMVVSPLDQALDTDNIGFLDRIKQTVQESVEKKDISIIMGVLDSMVKASKMSGLGLACGLYYINKNWETFGIDDDFVDYVYVVLGLHRHTTDRYIDVWSMYDNKEIPEEIAPRIMQQNIKSQIPIAKAIAQGNEFDEEQWEELAEASSESEVRFIIREAKGKEPRKGSLQLFLDRDGSLKVISDGQIFEAGYLDIFSDEPAVQKAVDRIVSNSGILRR